MNNNIKEPLAKTTKRSYHNVHMHCSDKTTLVCNPLFYNMGVWNRSPNHSRFDDLLVETLDCKKWSRLDQAAKNFFIPICQLYKCGFLPAPLLQSQKEQPLRSSKTSTLLIHHLRFEDESRPGTRPSPTEPIKKRRQSDQPIILRRLTFNFTVCQIFSK